MAGSARAVAVTSAVFVVAFVVGLAQLGDLAGSVGGSDDTFVEHFSSGSQRAVDIAGSLLLVVAAMAFLYFTQLIVAQAGPEARDHQATWGFVRGAGTVVTVGIVVAALSFLTVPLSISFGEFFDEPAFGEGQAVLPQFGYVALTVGAMFPAAVMIVAIARLRFLPTWLTRLSYLVAVLLVVTSLSVITMFVLLPAWVALTAVALRQTANQPIH